MPPGVGPGLLLGLGGAVLASQPPITSITLEDNGFRRWYAAARTLGVLSIALATLAVAFNLYWRLRYLFLSNEAFSGQDIAVIVTTLLYGAAAMVALVIASRWLIEKTAAARLATTALGASGALAATLVWILPIGRDVDAFHGIAENTSTAAVGYEGTCLGGRGGSGGADHAVRHLPDQAADAGRLPGGRREVPDTDRVLGVRRGRASCHRLPDRLSLDLPRAFTTPSR